mmetsp:Transcript_11131/g.17223  ORF Transcript_11131/g.17223 Transcript_11131/m.17223 type:complete len:331 (+) Transcript_11131:732-1724(+)
MSTRKGISCSPPWLELRHSLNSRRPFRLTCMSQMQTLRSAFVDSIAHDRSCTAKRIARLFVDRTLNISEIGCQHCHFVTRPFHLFNYIHIPTSSKGDMSIRLRRVILAPIEAISNVTCKYRSHRKLSFHLINIDLIFVFTQGLVRFFAARVYGCITNWIFPINNLVNNSYSNTLWILCSQENTLHRSSTFKVSIRCDTDKNGPLVLWTIFASCMIPIRVWLHARPNFHGCFAAHQSIIVYRSRPKFRHVHFRVTIRGVNNCFKVAIFISDRYRPLGRRDMNVRICYNNSWLCASVVLITASARQVIFQFKRMSDVYVRSHQTKIVGEGFR